MSAIPSDNGKTCRQAALRVNGVELLADLSGALFWPEAATLVVADLHLEKASAFAVRGQFLPPYDSRATLQRLLKCLESYQPDRVICLGDSFHDEGAAARLPDEEQQLLRTMTSRHRWIWICGNHDPRPPATWGGELAEDFRLGALQFRHEAVKAPNPAGEISGHFHPKASIRARGRRVTARCFIGDGRRLILPAFGSLAGGLDVLTAPIARLFPRNFAAYLLGRDRVVTVQRAALLGSGASDPEEAKVDRI